MTEQAHFSKKIDQWISEGGKFPKLGQVQSLEDAEALVRALLSGDLAWSKPPLFTPNIFKIAGLLQTNNAELLSYFHDHAARPLREFIVATLSDQSFDNNSDDQERQLGGIVTGCLFALQALIRLGHSEDPELVAVAARKPGYNKSTIWSSIFSHALHRHPAPERILDALRDPVPDEFCRLAYLDFANSLCFEKRSEEHPFNTHSGFDYLMNLIDEDDPGFDSHVRSAVSAAPFLARNRADTLIRTVRGHQIKHIRSEADWAYARLGEEDGIRFLEEKFQTVQYHTRAAQYLSALDGLLPELKSEDEVRFRALVEYSDWMANEQDLVGLPPEKIDIIDQFTVIWPNEDDRLTFWRVRYDTMDLFEDDPETARLTGISIVSSRGFYRFADDAESDLEACADIVLFDAAYKSLVDTWPDRDWCAQRLVALNPGMF